MPDISNGKLWTWRKSSRFALPPSAETHLSKAAESILRLNRQSTGGVPTIQLWLGHELYFSQLKCSVFRIS